MKTAHMTDCSGKYWRSAQAATEKQEMTRQTFTVLLIRRFFLLTVQAFSGLSYTPKHVEDLGLDLLVMSPEMLTPMPVPERDYPHVTLYIVVSHWASDGEYGSYEIPFTDLLDAKRQFHDDLQNEQEGGSIERWRPKLQFVEEETEASYECYLDGEYCENHFYIGLEQRSLPVSPTFMQSVAYLLAGACNKGQPHQ